MASTTETTEPISDESLISNLDWLEIKYIGQYGAQYAKTPIEGTIWVYTPSGRFCVCVCDIKWKNEDQYLYNNDYLLKFIDLVNKEYFEIKMRFEPFFEKRSNVFKIDCFYFTAEDELVLVAAYDTLVKQMVYKVNYINQDIEHKETINHTFMARNWHTWEVRSFASQPNKFIRCDGKDYVLLISNIEGWTVLHGIFYHLYMIPMYPAHKNAPTQECCIKLPTAYRTKDEDIRATLGEREAEFARLLLCPSSSQCILREKHLWFSLELALYPEENDFWGLEMPGNLIGAYWTIDVTKLKNVKNDEIATHNELKQVIEDHVDAMKFVSATVFHIAEKVHFWDFDKDVGFINVFTNNSTYNENGFVVQVYPANVNEPGSTAFDAGLQDAEIEGSYTLHPHGALLNVVFNDEGSIYIRVMKCLKTNLKSLALNKALFHEKTPIRYHPAYRLCFNGTKPMDYTSNKDDKTSLNRKIQDE